MALMKISFLGLMILMGNGSMKCALHNQSNIEIKHTHTLIHKFAIIHSLSGDALK